MMFRRGLVEADNPGLIGRVKATGSAVSIAKRLSRQAESSCCSGLSLLLSISISMWSNADVECLQQGGSPSLSPDWDRIATQLLSHGLNSKNKQAHKSSNPSLCHAGLHTKRNFRRLGSTYLDFEKP